MVFFPFLFFYWAAPLPLIFSSNDCTWKSHSEGGSPIRQFQAFPGSFPYRPEMHLTLLTRVYPVLLTANSLGLSADLAERGSPFRYSPLYYLSTFPLGSRHSGCSFPLQLDLGGVVSPHHPPLIVLCFACPFPSLLERPSQHFFVTEALTEWFNKAKTFALFLSVSPPPCMPLLPTFGSCKQPFPGWFFFAGWPLLFSCPVSDPCWRKPPPPCLYEVPDGGDTLYLFRVTCTKILFPPPPTGRRKLVPPFFSPKRIRAWIHQLQKGSVFSPPLFPWGEGRIQKKPTHPPPQPRLFGAVLDSLADPLFLHSLRPAFRLSRTCAPLCALIRSLPPSLPPVCFFCASI